MFHEFPKAVYLPGSAGPIIAEHAEHEAELLATVAVESAEDAPTASERDAEIDAVTELETAPRRRGRPPKTAE